MEDEPSDERKNYLIEASFALAVHREEEKAGGHVAAENAKDVKAQPGDQQVRGLVGASAHVLKGPTQYSESACIVN